MSGGACPLLEAEIAEDMSGVALHFLRRGGEPASDADLACWGFTPDQIAVHARGARAAAMHLHAAEGRPAPATPDMKSGAALPAPSRRAASSGGKL